MTSNPIITSPDSTEEEIRISNFEFRISAPLILSLDTSSKTTSIAVCRGDRVLTTYQSDADETRSERMWIEIQSLLDSCGVTVGEIDMFAACVGPGGFTGLRVGVGAPKGLAAARRTPLLCVPSLEVLAI